MSIKFLVLGGGLLGLGGGRFYFNGRADFSEVREPRDDSRESGDSRESVNRFT